MASLASSSPFGMRLMEKDGTLVVDEIDLCYSYSPNSDTPRYVVYEVVNLEQEYNSAHEDVFSSTGSSISALIEDILRHFHTKGAQITSLSKVRDYLYRFPEIAELSRYVSNLVYQHFDSSAQISLEIQDDEVPDSEYLVLNLRVPEYNDSVMDRIREIRESYYDFLNEVNGWLLLTTDFGSPR